MTPVDPPDPPTLPFAPPTQRDSNDLPERAGQIVADDPTTTSGTYALGEVIGRGGVGEVLLAHDRRIGRDVALKRLRNPEPAEDEIARFLREARIQARLDHPSIPPVYELARDPTGRPYFAMKRLTGTTLFDHLASGRATRQRLLHAFVDVCRAIDFAHSRGIVHRDLKPANVMLGEFGEVYVLDWGLARIVINESPIVTADIDTIEGTAAPGRIMGTPGYMAPEQIDDPEVRPSADVYSLGAILFEILAGVPLHPHDRNAIPSTRKGTAIVSPATRRPDRLIPPELDAACVAALAMAPSSRPSARALGEQVQDYLDGDRDVDRRRALAAVHLAEAREAALDPQSHVGALRSAGRSLALDPESKDAAALVTSLMLAPPRTMPPELEARLRAVDMAQVQRAKPAAIASLLAFLAFIPLLAWSGYTSFGLPAATYAVLVCVVAYIYWFAGRGGYSAYVVLVGLVLWVGLSSRLIGPFITGPAVIGIVAMAMMAQSDLLHRPVLVLSLILTAFLVPVALEAVGAIDSTWSIENDSVISRSAVIHLEKVPTTVILIAGNVATIVITGLFSRTLAKSRREAQRRVEIHAWRLQQLVPVAAGK